MKSRSLTEYQTQANCVKNHLLKVVGLGLLSVITRRPIGLLDKLRTNARPIRHFLPKIFLWIVTVSA